MNSKQKHITEEEKKEKYIEDVKKPLGCDYDYCLSCYTHARKSCMLRPQAEALYKAGYRKASDVIDEFVAKLKSKEAPKLLTWEYGEGYLDCIKIIDELAAKMRQEVEK